MVAMWCNLCLPVGCEYLVVTLAHASSRLQLSRRHHNNQCRGFRRFFLVDHWFVSCFTTGGGSGIKLGPVSLDYMWIILGCDSYFTMCSGSRRIQRIIIVFFFSDDLGLQCIGSCLGVCWPHYIFMDCGAKASSNSRSSYWMSFIRCTGFGLCPRWVPPYRHCLSHINHRGYYIKTVLKLY